MTDDTILTHDDRYIYEAYTDYETPRRHFGYFSRLEYAQKAIADYCPDGLEWTNNKTIPMTRWGKRGEMVCVIQCHILDKAVQS